MAPQKAWENLLLEMPPFYQEVSQRGLRDQALKGRRTRQSFLSFEAFMTIGAMLSIH